MIVYIEFALIHSKVDKKIKDITKLTLIIFNVKWKIKFILLGYNLSKETNFFKLNFNYR